MHDAFLFPAVDAAWRAFNDVDVISAKAGIH
jgi:hypothetical protein